MSVPLIMIMEEIINWANSNSGFLSLLIFFVTIFLGWITGIFKGLRSKPDLKIDIIEGPSFVCTFQTGKEYQKYPTHKTGISLYLKVTNIGSASTSIDRVMVGYQANYKIFTKFWLKYNIGKVWLRDPVISLSEYGLELEDGRKRVYPFLMQKSPLDNSEPKTFLRVGENQNGIVYFEQEEAFGGHFPFVFMDKVLLKVKVKDTFGRIYSRRFRLPMVGIDRARKFCSDFGKSHESFDGILEPDKPIHPDSLKPNE